MNSAGPGAKPEADAPGVVEVPPLSSLLRSTLVYGAGSVLNRVVTFVLLPILTRYLDPGEYGTSAILDVACALAVSIFSLGIGSSMTVCYFDTRDGDARRSTVSTAFLLQLAGCAALFALFGLAPQAWSRFTLGQEGHERLVLLSVATAAAMILQQPFSMRLQFEHRAGRLVLLNLVATVLLLAGSIIGVVLLGRGVAGLWEGRLAAHAVTFALFAAHGSPRHLLRWRGAVARELLRLGVPMIPSFAAVFVLLQANRYLLSLFAELDAVGVYSVGVQLGMAMGLAVSAFSTAWTPYFMSYVDRRDQAPETFSRATTFYVLGFGALSLAFYALARPALMVLTAAPFHGGYRVAGLAATAQLLIGVFNLLTPAGTFARELKSIGLVQVAAAVLAVPLNLLLIPRLGMIGAGLALAGGPALMAGMLWAWNRWRGERYLQVRYERSRLLPFAAFYTVAGVLLAAPRAWGLAAELGLAAGSLALIGAVVWLLLPGAERAGLLRWSRGRTALAGEPGAGGSIRTGRGDG